MKEIKSQDELDLLIQHYKNKDNAGNSYTNGAKIEKIKITVTYNTDIKVDGFREIEEMRSKINASVLKLIQRNLKNLKLKTDDGRPLIHVDTSFNFNALK